MQVAQGDLAGALKTLPFAGLTTSVDYHVEFPAPAHVVVSVRRDEIVPAA